MANPVYELKQPFYFMVAFWGERYRDDFVNFCLPSLLAPNNLPLLRAADGHRMLIATTKQDWNAIEQLPIVGVLRRHATPLLIEIKPPIEPTAPGGTAAIHFLNFCQKLLVDAAARDRVYASMLWPDILASDGFVAALLARAREGCHSVLCASLRQTQEDVLAELEKRGHLSIASPASQTGKPIVLPARTVAELQVRYMHPEVSILEEDNPRQPFIAHSRYWRIPNTQGIVLHSFFLQPMLMDFSAVDSHDSACLETGVFEDVYIGRNFYQCGGVHVVADSDEFGILCMTSKSIDQFASRVGRAVHRGTFTRACSVRTSMSFYARRSGDHLKRDVFRIPIRWHAADLDNAWHRREQAIENFLHSSLDDYYRLAADSSKRRFPPLISMEPRFFVKDLVATFRLLFADCANAVMRNLPATWRERVRIRDRILTLAQRLAPQSVRRSS